MSKKVKGNGEGTIYKGKNGLYIGQYVYKGKRYSLYQHKNETSRNFKAKFNSIINSINNNSYIEKKSITFNMIAKEFIEQKHTNGLVSEDTYLRDLNTLSVINKIGKDFVDKPIQKIEVYDIENIIDDIRQYSNSVIQKIWMLLNKVFDIAVSRRLILWSPMKDFALSKPISVKPTKKVEALTIQEESKFVDILSNEQKSHKYKNILLLQLNTGMRIGEVLALTRNDIDIKKGVINVDKTLTRDSNDNFVVGNHTKTFSRKTNIDKGKREFPITPQVGKILKDVLENNVENPQNLLFFNLRTNEIVKPYEINCYLKRLNDKYHITTSSLSSHVLRHTFITRCREKGIDLFVLQKIVGHVAGSDITNNVYTSVSNEFINQEITKI